MQFDFLNKVDDNTGDFKAAYRRCSDAKTQYEIGYYNQSIDFYNKAMNIVIQCVYARERLGEPKIHDPKYKTPSNADYMYHDSPFAKWLDNKQLLNKCNDIRQLRNNTTPSHIKASVYNATSADVQKVERDLEQIFKTIISKLSDTSFRNPSDFHQPCVILLDVSGSMNGAEGTPVGARPIDELYKAVKEFEEDLKKQRDINGCTEVSFITFGSEVKVIQPFTNADRFRIPELNAEGTTAMNEAIEKALEIIELQKSLYKKGEVDYYRPWIFLLSDGVPTDNTRELIAKKKLKEAISGHHVMFYPVKIGKWADEQHLRSYYPDNIRNKKVIVAKEGHFSELFRFFSNSIRASIKTGGDTTAIERVTPTGIIVEGR